MQEVIELPSVIETSLAKENVTAAVIAKLKADYLPLKIADINDKEGYKAVDDARKVCKKLRGVTKDICEAGREDAVKTQKEWIAKQKEVTGEIQSVESYLQGETDRIDAEKEAIAADTRRKQQELIQTRVAALVEAGCAFDGVQYSIGDIKINHSDLVGYSDEFWNNSLIAVKEVAFKIAIERLEAERLEKERIAMEAEERRQYEVDKKAFEEQQAKAKAEQERIAKEQADKEAASIRELALIAKEQEETRLKQVEAQRKIDAENKRLEDVRVERLWRGRLEQLPRIGWNGQFAFCKITDDDVAIFTYEELISISDEEYAARSIEYNRLVNDKLAELEAKRIADEEKASRIRKEQADAAEAKRLQDIEDAKEASRLQAIADEQVAQKNREAQAEADRTEAARLAALAPDKEKLLKLSEAIGALPIPTVHSESANKLLDDCRTMIGKLQAHILTKIKTL